MSSKESRRSAREKLAEERRQQALADARKRRMWNIVIAIAVVVVVVGLGALVLAQKNKGPAQATLPTGVSGQAEPLVVGSSDAPVQVALWEDFQCPVCKLFESTNGQQIQQLVDDNQIQVQYHMVTFLDDAHPESNNSSARAANAFACASDEGKAQAFHAAVYANQPSVEGTGYTDEQLIQFGKDVGITGSTFEQCVNDGKYLAYVKQVESSMTSKGVTGTPTIFINGREVKSGSAEYRQMLSDPSAFAKAVAAAGATVSPSPSSS